MAKVTDDFNKLQICPLMHQNGSQNHEYYVPQGKQEILT